ncbi:MAG: glycosyltransferase family 39 protein [Vicinamibacterales bacterium]
MNDPADMPATAARTAGGDAARTTAGRAHIVERGAVFALVAVQAAILLSRITSPFTEPAAYGRSCVNATIARNFFEQGMHFLYPQLDYGPAPGYAALEFPLVPYMAAALYWLAGVHEWIGRGIPAAFGLGTTVVVWLIAREVTTHRAARIAAVAIMVLSPTFAFFSRVFQSDSVMVFFVVLALWLLLRARRDESPRVFVAACAACAVAMLLKPSSLVLLPALALVCLSARRHGIARAMWLCGTTVVPVAAYYLFARTINTYPETLGLDAVVQRATFSRMLQLTYDVQIAKDIVQAVTPAGIVALACGVALALRRAERWFLVLWALGAAGLNLLFNEALSHHEYYQLIWVPLAALAAAITVEEASASPRLSDGMPRLAVLGVALLLVAGSAALSWRFLALRLTLPPAATQRLAAARLVEEHTPADAQVAVEEIDLLYYSHRRGWPYGRDTGEPISPEQIRGVAGRGVEFLLVSDPEGTLSDEARRYLGEHAVLQARGERAMLWRLARD